MYGLQSDSVLYAMVYNQIVYFFYGINQTATLSYGLQSNSVLYDMVYNRTVYFTIWSTIG